MKRLNRLGGLVVGVAAGVAAIAVLKKDRPSVVPAEGPSTAPTPARAVASPPAAEDADDLSVITGIGPVYSNRLAAAGITTFAALGAAGPDAVADAAGIGVERAAAWIAAATDLAG